MELLLMYPVFLVLSSHCPYVPSFSAGGVVILIRNMRQGRSTWSLREMEGEFPVLVELRPGVSAGFQNDKTGADEQNLYKAAGIWTQLVEDAV